MFTGKTCVNICTVRYEQCDMAPYRAVAHHAFSMGASPELYDTIYIIAADETYYICS